MMAQASRRPVRQRLRSLIAETPFLAGLVAIGLLTESGFLKTSVHIIRQAPTGSPNHLRAPPPLKRCGKGYPLEIHLVEEYELGHNLLPAQDVVIDVGVDASVFSLVRHAPSAPRWVVMFPTLKSS